MLATLFYHPSSLKYHLTDSMRLRRKASPKRLTYRMGRPNPGCQRRKISKCNDIRSSGRFFIKNDDDRIVFSLDVPGIKIDDLSVEVENGVMTVLGQRTIDIGSDSPRCKKRRVFHQLKISDRVDPENVTANLLNGVLTISFPKTEPSKPSQIKIIEGHNNIKETKGEISQNESQNDRETGNEDDLVLVETVENKEDVMDESDGVMKS
jgi:HSP20 family protein